MHLSNYHVSELYWMSQNHWQQCNCSLISSDHSFPWQIFLNSVGQFANFRGSSTAPDPIKYAVFVTAATGLDRYSLAVLHNSPEWLSCVSRHSHCILICRICPLITGQ